MSEVSVRNADKSDVRLLSALAAATFYEAYFEQDAANDLANYIAESFSPAAIADEIADENSTFLIAEMSGKAVGYVKLRENSHADCVAEKNVLEIQRIYLLEKLKGKGIGRFLIENCIEFAKDRKFSALWLGVWSENSQAQQFYRKMNFEHVGEVKFRYGDGEETNFVYRLMLDKAR